MARILLATALVPLLGVTSWVTVTQRGVLADTADQNLGSHAALEAQAVAGILGQAKESIDILAANPALRQRDGYSADDVLTQLQAFTSFEDVSLVAPSGTVIESVTYNFTGTWLQNPAFRLALQGEPAISEARLISGPSRLIVEFGSPVIEEGETTAVVVGRMNMQRVWDALDAVQIGDSGFMAAFDRHGNLIAHPDKELLLTKLDGFPESLPLTGTTPMDVSQSDGPDLVGQLAPVGVLGWSVAALQNDGEAYALANDTVRKVVIAVVAVVIFAVLGAAFISRAVAKPIHTLGGAMRAIAEGNLTQRTSRAGLEEIDDLATSFNTMAGNLEQRTGELRNRTEKLEEEVDQRQRAEERIRHYATHDSLTNLPNRTLLMDRANLALAKARRSGGQVGMALIDLDQFKLINDTMGHTVGDQLLRDVADRLSEVLRESDTLARIGGDEFVVLLPDVSRVEVVHGIIDRVLTGMRQVWQLRGQELHVTASIGVALFPDDGGDSETLLRNADTAMYRAKEAGRDNATYFAPAMNAHLADRVKLEGELRKAIELEEFVVHYQPQVDTQTHAITGFEALVRWEHPERGLVGPGEFIPLAEEIGIIGELGTWVLRTACAQMLAWLGAGYDDDVCVAVNVSARQFQQKDLMDTVRSALSDTGLAARNLEIEITESVAMQDAEHSIAVLGQLKELGVRLSIDDFGTGYSSLSYLKRLPIDTVKIDQSFIRNVASDPDDAAIVASIIKLAESLRLGTIAEGVETEEQLEFLSDHGCPKVQGYLFGKPKPPNEIVLKSAGRMLVEAPTA